MGFTKGAGAVVTGAGSGFGRAVAHALAQRGLRVLASDIDGNAAETTARVIRERGGDAESLVVDVRDAAAVEALRDRADSLYGGPEVLVNNAGVAVAGAVGDVSLDDWKWQVDINLWGVIHGCHFFVPGMRTRRRGFVLNVASAAGIVSAPMMAPYNVTKAGVIALTETLASEAADDGVVATALCPSFFRTEIHSRARSTADNLREATEKLVTRSRWSAEQIAEHALDGLARGALYVMPQRDIQVMWRAKRLLGATFFGGMRLIARRSGLIQRSE